MEPSRFCLSDYNPKTSWITPLKLGTHRRSQAVMHRFIAKMEEMEKDFQELKARRLRLMAQAPQDEDLKEKEWKLFLKCKLDRFNSNSKFAIPEILEKLEKVRTFFLQDQRNEDLKQQFLDQIKLLISCYQEGVIFYFCRRQQKAMDLMDYLEILALTPQGREILQNDKEVFFEFGNAYVLTIGKKLSLLHPKNDDLETLFSEIIALWSTSQEAFNNAIPEIETIQKLIVKIHTINDEIHTALQTSIETVRQQLSQLTKPKKGGFLDQPDLEMFAVLLEENSLVDDPENERLKKLIGHVLSEILDTEKEFRNKSALIAESTLFQALVKEKVVVEEEGDVVQKGWTEVVKSSEKLIGLLNRPSDTLSQQLKNCFLAFSPQEIESHMENINSLVCRFIEADRILKRIKESKKGEQMLLGFSAVHRVEIVDIWIRPMQRLLRYNLLLTELQNRLKDEIAKEAMGKRISYLKQWSDAINLMRV